MTILIQNVHPDNIWIRTTHSFKYDLSF